MPRPAWSWTLYHPSRITMNPIGYHYYLARRAKRLGRDSGSAPPPSPRSITDPSRNHDMALGVLLMTVIAAVPVLITAVFLLVFKF